MAKSIEVIDQKLAQLHKQIEATTNAKSLTAKDKLIILEGYAKAQQKLLQEKKAIKTAASTVLNCTVGKATPVPNYLQRSFAL